MLQYTVRAERSKFFSQHFIGAKMTNAEKNASVGENDKKWTGTTKRTEQKGEYFRFTMRAMPHWLFCCLFIEMMMYYVGQEKKSAHCEKIQMFFFRLNKFWIEKSSLNCQIHARPTVAISKYASENDCALFSPINVKQADVFNAELFQTKIQIVINGKNIDSKTNMRRKRK